MSEVIQAKVEFYSASTGWGRASSKESRRIMFGQVARAEPQIENKVTEIYFERRLILKNVRCDLAHPQPGDRLFLTAVLDSAGWRASAWCFDYHWIDAVTQIRSTLYRVMAHRWAPGLRGIEELSSQIVFTGNLAELNRTYPRWEGVDSLAEADQLLTSVTYSFAYKSWDDPEVWVDIPDPRHPITRE